MSAGVTRELAGWLAGLRHDDVPQTTRLALRRLGLDTLGAALAGRSRPWSEAIRRWALAAAPGPAPHGRATLWGEREAVLRAADAALVNGATAHAYELDDYHNAKLHPGAVVLPATLGLGEAIDADGARCETALAAGYEVMIRTSLALGPAAARLRGWHLTAVCGTIGAAAAASVLLGLDSERSASALGLAGTQSGGLFAFNADGSASKRFHAGRAAQSGVMAAELAAEGLTGPSFLYEAEDGGFLRAFVDVPDATWLTDGLGTRWHAEDSLFKPYSCCGSLHSHVDAALELRPRWRSGGRVRVGLAKVVEVQCGYDYSPGSELNAQMSARYCVAAALSRGAVLPDQFTPEQIADPAVTRLAQAIELVHDPALDKLYPARFAGWVEVEAAEGGMARIQHLDPSGSPANPVMDESLRRKFFALAEPALGRRGAKALAAGFDRLDEVTARQLVRCAAIPPAKELAQHG